MKVCTPEYFKKFECINSECTDTCCKHWRVEIDKSTYAKYDKAIKNSNSLGITVKKHIRKRKNVYFKNCTDGSCPFLNGKKLCSLHIDFGYDILPHTCKAYPRFYNSFGLYEEAGLSFSCPAAAEIICAGDDDLKVIDDNRCIEVYTDVDAQLFYAVKHARDEIYKFLSNSNLNLNSKIFIILEYADSVQKAIDNKDYDKIKLLTIDTSENCEFDYTIGRIKVIKKHLRLTVLSKEWKSILRKAIQNTYSVSDEDGSTWLKYFIYRYLINASKNKAFKSVINGAVCSLLVIGSLEFSFVISAQKYSKEIEHNEVNIKKILNFKKIFKKRVDKGI